MVTQYCVKIIIYKGNFIRDKVVYYRNKLPMDMVDRWRWYFEYLAARIKVSNPRNKVDLIVCPQTLLQGDEYIEAKIKSLLRAKKAALKKCDKGVVDDDLFSFKSQKNDEKIKALNNEIIALENGDFPYYVPVEYVNNLKDFISYGKT